MEEAVEPKREKKKKRKVLFARLSLIEEKVIGGAMPGKQTTLHSFD